MKRQVGKLSASIRVGGIVACAFIVFGFLLPGLWHIMDEATKAARISSCKSNLKQLAQSIRLYEQDWDNRLPLATAWMDAIRQYHAGDYLRCPDYPSNAPGLGYAYNSNVSSRRYREVSNPAKMPLLYDSDIPRINAHAPGRIGLADPPRHRMHSMNAIVFLDGHTAILR